MATIMKARSICLKRAVKGCTNGTQRKAKYSIKDNLKRILLMAMLSSSSEQEKFMKVK